MKNWQASAPALHLPIMNNKSTNTAEVRAAQVASKSYDRICLGVDLHKASITVTRIIDGSTPDAARRFSWDGFWKFVNKQRSLAKQVCVVYEAGAFGFWPCRQLQQKGVECYVIHPEKLDPRQKRVQTDRRDSAVLADKLYRYVNGNHKAMTAVYVPTEAEEQARLEGRHRNNLAKELKRLQARGRGLLLGQGITKTTGWWLERNWAELGSLLLPSLKEILADIRQSIEHFQSLLKVREKNLKATAPPQLPVGMGRLTFVLLQRELCNYERFKSRRSIGGFTGLCGGVSSSGPYHLDLSINKAGSARLRAWLVELAWRMLLYQPKYRGLKIWNRLCGLRAGPRRRKIAIIAIARQVMVDIWRWQTGRVSPEQLGWRMSEP